MTMFPLPCHCEERSDAAISWNNVQICTQYQEIATPAARNDSTEQKKVLLLPLLRQMHHTEKGHQNGLYLHEVRVLFRQTQRKTPHRG